MTDTSEKLRGLFLAALMVFSVFAGTIAFSGAAAAATNDVGVDSAVEYNSGNIEIVLNKSVSSVSSVSVDVNNGPDYSPTASTQDVSGQTVINVDVGTDIQPNRDVNVTVSGSNSGSFTVTDSVRVTSNDLKESNAGNNQNRKRLYQGEDIAMVADDSSFGTDIVIDGPSGVALDGYTEDSSKVLVFDSDGNSLGNYSAAFDPDNANNVRKFSLNNLGLSATVNETDINEGDAVKVNVSAIRGNSPVTLESNGTALASTSLNGNAEASFVVTLGSFGTPPVDGDTYNLSVVDNQTGVTADTDQVNSQTIPSQSVEFANVETDQRGDVVGITLDVDNQQVPVTLTLGTENDAYVSNVTVKDSDNDGTIDLEWNTFEADKGTSANNNDENNHEIPIKTTSPTASDETTAAQWSVTNDTIVGTNSSTQIAEGPQHIIAPGTYEMSARVGGYDADANKAWTELSPNDKDRSVFNSSANAFNAEAVQVVSLEQRGSSPEINLWKAPSAYSGPLGGASATNITEFVDNGTLNQGDQVAKGDVIVAQIQSEGVEGALESNTLQALASGDAELYVNVTQDIGTGSNVSPQAFNLGGNGSGTADTGTGVSDAASDTYYVVYDTSALGSNGLLAGEDYDVEYRLVSKKVSSSNFGLVAPTNNEFADEVVTESFSMKEGTATINKEAATGNVVVENASGQSVSGTSTYAPTTELDVRLQSKSGSPYQFIKGPRTVEVSEDGTWELDSLDMTSDTAGVSAAGSEFTVTVSKNGETQATADGVIRGPRDADLTYQDPQPTRGEVITVDSADLNYGGFVVVKDASGNVLGNSDYIPVNKIGSNIRIPVDTLQSSQTLTLQAYADSNGNEEFDMGTDEAYPSQETVQANLEGASPDFQLSDLDPQSETVTVGDTIEVSATVTNEGNEAGEQDVTLTAGGQTLGTETVSLDPGASDTVTFSGIDTSALGAGDYTHTVSSDDSQTSGSLTVESDETQTTTEPTTSEPTTSEPTTAASGGDGNDSDDGDDGDGESGPGFGIVVAVMALLAAALLAARRNE